MPIDIAMLDGAGQGAAAPNIRGRTLRTLRREIVGCGLCPRLVAFREDVARGKKREFAGWVYWGRPVPGFGDPKASLLIVGLAPAAHGGNRTGRVFTGDRSGDFLIGALHRAGYANHPQSISRRDGLKLRGVYLTAAVKCAPPDNKPMTSEFENCASYLAQELKILDNVKAILCLGHFAYNSVSSVLRTCYGVVGVLPSFHHGLETRLSDGSTTVFASYHPSPRNTQTGKLTMSMFLSLLSRISKRVAEIERAR